MGGFSPTHHDGFGVRVRFDCLIVTLGKMGCRQGMARTVDIAGPVLLSHGAYDSACSFNWVAYSGIASRGICC
jgi:hypothetical protein